MKTLLITGTTSGIGEALAHFYANQGWQVCACGRNQEKLNSLASEFNNITPLSFDVTNKQEVEKAASQLSEKLDLVILNAGTCEYINNPMKFDSDLFERVINTNLISIGYCLEFLLPQIKPGGRIAFMSSSASYLPLPRAAAYGASKAALNYVADTLRIELQKFDISVSLICPGFVETPLTDKNQFSMPMRITSKEAAEIIASGIANRKDHIDFPRLFMLILRFLSFLPKGLWRRLAKRMA